MTRKSKLELAWIGKENRPKLKPRILLEDAEKSYHAPHRVTENAGSKRTGYLYLRFVGGSNNCKL